MLPTPAEALPAAPAQLLADGDIAPVLHRRGGARSPLLILIDHAGRRVPQRLGDLGIPPREFDRHIAWDIGVAGLGERLGERLGAETIAQSYSRLVVDCNRRPGHPTFIAPRSDGTPVPANAGLSAQDAAARQREIWAPYHDAIAACLDARAAAAIPTVVFALHSFTPVMDGFVRPWHVGLLYNRQPEFAAALCAEFEAEAGLVIGDNEPYRLGDDSDYTVPVHAEARSLPSIEIEIRQDLIADAQGEAAWAERLARILPRAVARLGIAAGGRAGG